MRSEAGFTLAEVLAALAVFSIAALALLHLSAENARAAGIAREHAYAAIVAENVLVEAAAQPEPLEQGAQNGAAQLAGRDWIWTRIVAPTGEPGFARIDVEVRLAAADHISAALTGFRGPR